jgi:pyruvate ferredoxin oxidoreductase gamma subunit
MTEIRWHARAGQGAKTAAQLLALALLRSGQFVQAFPEYGPERRGAPMRAYTRVDDHPIRRHDGIETPDVVVVLEPSLVDDPTVRAGLGPDGILLVNAERAPRAECRTLAVPAARIAASSGSGFVNLVMLGAVAAALGRPALDDVVAAAIGHLGKKADPDAIRVAVEGGWNAAAAEEPWAA